MPGSLETASYKYSFRLNEEKNIRFNELLCKAGPEHNRSRFIVKRIFAEEFVVVKHDPSKVQFVARLNDFLFPNSKTEKQQDCKGYQYALIQRCDSASDSRIGTTHTRVESPKSRDSEP